MTNKKKIDLTCVFCENEIPDESVAFSAEPVRKGYCCVECYTYKVMGAKIINEINKESKRKEYLSKEKRVFTKKETTEDSEDK